ncbi:stage II sporulation protein M [bacterium]|nr:stage II sporulation protein M [bacterium]
MEGLKKRYKKLIKFNKENRILLIFSIVSLSFFVIALLGYAIGSKYQEYAAQFISEFLQSKSYMINDDGSVNCLLLIYNNIVACVVGIITGIVPFVFNPILSIFLNSTIIGIVIGALNTGDMPVISYILVGILPHGIFELPAMMYSFSLGIYLCIEVTKTCLKKNKHPMKKVLLDILWSFLLVIIPLLIVAGLVEAYITPLLIAKFIS